MIANPSFSSWRSVSIITLSWLIWQSGRLSVRANPGIGSVAQGSATFSTSGSHETITTSANTLINWNGFNINAGETTTFVEPSASSVVWNNIAGGNASQILGNLNANGYVILQNQSGFYIGGQASISAHGLILTTSPTPAPELSSGGAWEFNAPPPTAKIINYGQINIAGGGSAFLIAGDIENNGTISAPSGNIGLYAGEQVLVSTSPNGLGLSAKVTLPQGSVDNEGKLIADGGTIAAAAQVINQDGLAQANSMQNVNGTIELVGSDSVDLGANSTISAHGDSSGSSPGGSVTIQSANSFSDQAGSTINISGGAQGGSGGQVEISAPEMNPLQSAIDGRAAAGFAGAKLTIDPTDITLDSTYEASLNNLISGGLSLINLQADNDIEITALWNLADLTAPGSVTLTAGNNIVLDNGAGIAAGQDWTVNLAAGTAFARTANQPTPASGNDGIYLLGNSYVQSENGNLNLSAANQVVVNWYSDNPNNAGAMNIDVTEINGNVQDVLNSGPVGNNGIRTLNGGNIYVDTQYGDVITGGNSQGFSYGAIAPYFSANSTLGGVSTVGGGNVTINAGRDVISYAPQSTDTGDPGSGAFGSEPGNVTITAGGSVYGHYVLVNGIGTITADGNVGGPIAGDIFALSLVGGTWNINAPNGNIYLQEVRNPNGDFNNLSQTGLKHTPNPGYHLFDYAPDATVDLTAGDGVYLTANGTVNSPDTALPRVSTAGYNSIQVIYPPILDITAGAGGINLAGDVTLFPSVDQNLNLTTTDGGSLIAGLENSASTIRLLMSDSSQAQWIYNSLITPFSVQDNSSGVPVQSGNPGPANINISGSIENLYLITSKATDITVGGNMINSGFSGQNLNASDVTSITVAGQIYNQGSFSYVDNVSLSSVPASDLLAGIPNSWAAIFYLAVNPAALPAAFANLQNFPSLPSSQWAQYLLESSGVSVFGVTFQNGAPTPPAGLIGNTLGGSGFNYNPATGQLGFVNQMPSSVLSALEQPITVLKLVNGVPVPITVKNPDGTTTTTYETDTVNWAPPSVIQTLYADNLGVPNLNSPSLGYVLGGPGQFDINAGSISLGSCAGILTCGVLDQESGFERYGNLVSITPSGASLNVTVGGDINMLSSTIATLGGGDVNVTSTGGSIDLGSQNLVDEAREVGFGIFSAAQGDVSVSTFKDIDIGGSRIAAYDGGNIFVESLTGDINVGSGGDSFNPVELSYTDPNGKANYYAENVNGSGILATTLVTPESGASYSVLSSDWPADHAAVPGNITIEALRGNITADLGGITQEALNGNVSGGPIVTLVAGTLPSGTPGSPGYSPGYTGNIDLGQSGVIGGTVDATANGNISGLIISRQNSNINAAQNFSGSVLSGGSVGLAAGGSVVGVIVGVGGASVSGSSVTASVLGQDVSVNGGAAQSTLGSSANATSTSQSAALQASSATQQLANNDQTTDDDINKKKKGPVLMQRTKRVTVILPKST